MSMFASNSARALRFCLTSPTRLIQLQKISNTALYYPRANVRPPFCQIQHLNLTQISLRCKSTKKHSKKEEKISSFDGALDDEDGLSEDDLEDDHVTDADYEDDETEPKGHKNVRIVVSSNRATTIANQTFSLGSKQLNEFYLGGRIKLNNIRLKKKSVKAEVGDVIDVIVKVEDETVILQRASYVANEGKTSKGNEKVLIRKWGRLTFPRIKADDNELL